MLSYWFNSNKNTENKNSKILKTKKMKIILQSKCAVCDSKK